MEHQKERRKRDLFTGEKQHISKVGLTHHPSSGKQNIKERKTLLEFQHSLHSSPTHCSKDEIIYLKGFPVQECLPCNLIVEQLKGLGLHAAFSSKSDVLPCYGFRGFP